MLETRRKRGFIEGAKAVIASLDGHLGERSHPGNVVYNLA
jgi:hypothetical protein